MVWNTGRPQRFLVWKIFLLRLYTEDNNWEMGENQSDDLNITICLILVTSVVLIFH